MSLGSIEDSTCGEIGFMTTSELRRRSMELRLVPLQNMELKSSRKRPSSLHIPLHNKSQPEQHPQAQQHYAPNRQNSPRRAPRLLPPPILHRPRHPSRLDTTARPTTPPQRRARDLRETPRTIHRSLQHSSLQHLAYRPGAADPQPRRGLRGQCHGTLALRVHGRHARHAERARESRCQRRWRRTAPEC